MFLCYFPATLQLYNSPGNCARELFKYSKYVASLLKCDEKNSKVLDFKFLTSDISGVGFRLFWLRLPGPGPQPLDGIFWLQVLMGNKAMIQVFWAFDWLSSISGLKVMV